MSNFILRNTTPVENRGLPSSYHTYVAIEVDGDNRQQVATIKKVYRPEERWRIRMGGERPR